MLFQVFLNHHAAHRMSDQHRRSWQGRRRLGQVGDVIDQPPGVQVLVALAEAVAAQADGMRLITMPGEVGQEIDIPRSGIRERAMHEQ